MTTTLVYDGDCGICTTSARLVTRLGLRADVVVPWQRADLATLDLTAAQCQEAVQFVEDGRVTSGHEAIARLLLRSAWWWRPIALPLLVPPMSWLAARVYRWVADNRYRLPGTAACAMPQEGAPPAA